MSIEQLTLAAWSAGAVAIVAAAAKANRRLTLSRAKHRSLGGHVRMGKRIAGLIPFYEYDDDRFFRADDPPAEVAAHRRAAFATLARLYRERYRRSVALTEEVKPGLSDLQFTSSYRVPFQFRRKVGEQLGTGAFLASSAGVTVTDLDGNVFHDLTGSYGVNLFGYDVYKACIAEAVAQAGDLGPVLGAFHPVLADNVSRLRAISGLDEVSFHMSGTEAVMQAVRLARYHTGRSHIVRFAGAYNGWWGEVQPGIGNPVPADRTYTLADMSDRTLAVLASRRNIACVIVNPLQALHPNRGAPGRFRAGRQQPHRAGGSHCLRRLAEAAGGDLRGERHRAGPGRGVHRLPPRPRRREGVFRGAAGYDRLRQVAGRRAAGGRRLRPCPPDETLRDDRPADICFARGTFNAHPYVMAAMNAFLRRLETPAVAEMYRDLARAGMRGRPDLNRRLAAEDLPVTVANLSTIWTVSYTRPLALQLDAAILSPRRGLALSWVGTGRIIFSLNYGDADFAAVADRFVAAARAMRTAAGGGRTRR